MGKGTDPQDPGNKKKRVTTVDDPSAGKGARSGSSAESESKTVQLQWKFVLVDTTTHASSLQEGDQIEGIMIDERIQVERRGVLMGFAPARIARRILSSRHLGSDLSGEVESIRPEGAEVVLRLNY